MTALKEKTITNEQLVRENLVLKTENDTIKDENTQLKANNDATKDENEQLKTEIDQLKVSYESRLHELVFCICSMPITSSQSHVCTYDCDVMIMLTQFSYPI